MTSDIATTTNAANLVGGMYSSITADSFDARKAIFSAVSNATNIADHLDKAFNLTDVILQKIELEDEFTGDPVSATRVILIDDEGNARAAISNGLVSSVQSLIAVMGQPSTWETPITVMVVERKAKRGKTFVLNIV